MTVTMMMTKNSYNRGAMTLFLVLGLALLSLHHHHHHHRPLFAFAGRPITVVSKGEGETSPGGSLMRTTTTTTMKMRGDDGSGSSRSGSGNHNGVTALHKNLINNESVQLAAKLYASAQINNNNNAFVTETTRNDTSTENNEDGTNHQNNEVMEKRGLQPTGTSNKKKNSKRSSKYSKQKKNSNRSSKHSKKRTRTPTPPPPPPPVTLPPTTSTSEPSTAPTTSEPTTGPSQPPTGSSSSSSSRCDAAHFGLSSDDTFWETWNGDVSTYAPVVRPQTDKELQEVIRKATAYGCTLRMSGAGNSGDGLVMQRKEQNTVVVSLSSHQTQHLDWQDQLYEADARPQETDGSRVDDDDTVVRRVLRIGAGKSWYDVSATIRPQGFVLKSRTTQQYFSVGGVIANMVHGGGRGSTGFIHDDVTKLLVVTSEGTMQEISDEEDLHYWRSSAGLLGIIVAVEMNIHSEGIPYIVGLNTTTGTPILDATKGGLLMQRDKHIFEPPPEDPANIMGFMNFIGNITAPVLQIAAIAESHQFFYNFYGHQLGAYYTTFGGTRFTGPTNGSAPNPELSAHYTAATQALAEANPEAAATGGPKFDFSPELLCETFCLPPSGPPAFGGDGTACVKIPSQLKPGKLLCQVPLELNAAISGSVQMLLDAGWDATKATTNDGYFLDTGSTATFDSLIAFMPARVFSRGFSTWYQVTGQVITGSMTGTGPLEGALFFPNGNLEFRFVNPTHTAVLNPIPPIDELKADFDRKYNALYGGVESAFDLLFPPPPPGAPDGYVAIELVNIRGVYDENASKYFFALKKAWSAMPSNPLLPYIKDVIIPDCDPLNGIFPCQGLPQLSEKTCCNPVVPTKLVHFGKGWGWDIDPDTTPTTGQFVPYHDPVEIGNMFTLGTKKNSIANFQSKMKELQSEQLFGGGSMHRFFDVKYDPTTEFEVRKLDGQLCGSPKFQLDPNKECIKQHCEDDSFCLAAHSQ